ncbi:MerC domain-containing protein [Bacillus sp. NP157]|nr:MerC domain-containing protein [Bacillus sp. NP157]
MTDTSLPPETRRRWWHVADRLGATASFLCAVHCAVLPFVLALLPFIGLGFLASHAFEGVFVSCATVLASFALVSGYRRHHHVLPLLLAGPGLVLLILGVTVLHDRSLFVHALVVTCGGLLVATSHFINLRVDRSGHAGHIHGPTCAHP